MRRPSRSAVLLGLVVVLLASVPVLIPLLVTNTSGEPAGPPVRLAAVPLPTGVPGPPVATDPPPGAAGPLAPTAARPTPGPRSTAPAVTATTTATSPAAPAPAPPAATSTDPTTAPPQSPTASAGVLSAGSDLVVVSVSWTPAEQLVAGEPVTFAAVVRNDGTDPTPDLTHDVAFSVDGTKVTWSASSSTPLQPGEERTYTADGGVAGSTWTAVSGEHTVVAAVDDVNRIPELDESDNTATAPVTVP